MANLTVSVRREGNNLVVSGSAITSVMITVAGQTQTVQPDGSGSYTATFVGLGNATGSVTVSSDPKVVAVELDADVEEVDTSFDLLALESVKAKRKPNDAIEVSGKFKDNSSHPASVMCTREASGELQTGTVTNKKWSVTFENCPGGGHKFRLDG